MLQFFFVYACFLYLAHRFVFCTVYVYIYTLCFLPYLLFQCHINVFIIFLSLSIPTLVCSFLSFHFFTLCLLHKSRIFNAAFCVLLLCFLRLFCYLLYACFLFFWFCHACAKRKTNNTFETRTKGL